MYRGATSTVIIEVADMPSSYSDVQVILEQKGKKWIKGIDELAFGTGTITFRLTEEESLAFAPGDVQVQVRVVTDGEVIYSDLMRYPVHPTVENDDE